MSSFPTQLPSGRRLTGIAPPPDHFARRIRLPGEGEDAELLPEVDPTSLDSTSALANVRYIHRRPGIKRLFTKECVFIRSRHLIAWCCVARVWPTHWGLTCPILYLSGCDDVWLW